MNLESFYLGELLALLKEQGLVLLSRGSPMRGGSAAAVP